MQSNINNTDKYKKLCKILYWQLLNKKNKNISIDEKYKIFIQKFKKKLNS